MTYPRRGYAGYHGVFGVVMTGDRSFIRFVYSALAVMVVIVFVADAFLSPLQPPPPPQPTPESITYNEELSLGTMVLHYLLGLFISGLIMLLAIYRDGTIQRRVFRWRWSLWQKYGQAALVGEAPQGWIIRRLARLFDPTQVRLDTFYQWLAEANSAFEEGRFETAVETYRRAGALRPTSVVARVNLGAALGRLGRHAEALEVFRQVLASDGTNGDALKNAAVALLRTGRPAEAEATLAPHLATHGRDAEAWWLAALCRAADPEAGAIEVAEALERACRLQPSRRDAIGGESAFGPYLTHPAMRALLPSAPVEV